MEAAQQEATAPWKPDYAPGILMGFFSHELCERIITIAESSGFEQSLVYGDEAVPTHLPEVRGSETSAINVTENGDIYAAVADIIQKYNRERYRFDIKGMDSLQVIRYRTGAFFKEHTDIGMEGAAHRKISVILQLSDSSDYEGGELEIGDYMKVPRTRGSGCIFPSWVPHVVRPVTSGLRYSLVSWAVGDFFR